LERVYSLFGNLVQGKQPGGFLYRKDAGTEAVGGFFCGYLTDEAWHYRIAKDK
jgi:hypothetical protein